MMYASSLLNGLRVLVIDGHSDSRELLAMLFEPYGVEMLPAASVGEALDILSRTPPDLLISELRLPDEDGYLLMQKVRDFEIAHGVQIPAIALTTSIDNLDRDRALAGGFCQYISKPCNLDELMESVTGLVEQYQSNSSPADSPSVA
jgi:CheY-like chemotaxis protein